jgi:hypothetical protein
LAAFLNGGGTAFFLGESNSTVFLTVIGNINSALTALGSGLSIIPDLFDPGYNFATIAADPLTVAAVRDAALRELI